MNPELLERFLAKKAKKLGISVEELKARGTSPVSSTQTDSVQTSMQPTVSQTGCAEQTFQQPVLSQQPATPSESQYTQQYSQPEYVQDHIAQTNYGMQPETVKTEIPSYVFGPAKMEETHSYTQNNYNQPTYQQTTYQQLDTRENKFCLIGYPLGHSLSKVIHEAGFKSLGLQASYEVLETPPDNLVDRIKMLKTDGFKGFNVTIPLKLPISLFVNEVDKYADLARAVNTVYIDTDKTLKAYNTDVIGFKRAIPSDINLKGKKVAILGTGGAAHAACVALTECEVEEIAFFTRNIPNSIQLMNYVRSKFPTVNFNVYQIENIRNLQEYAMLVNTTPLGMLGRGADYSPVEPYALQTLNKDAVVYDVIYNPKKTVLIKEAQKLNLRTITGLDMLIYQAVAAQEIWFGRTPDFKDMKIAALEEL